MDLRGGFERRFSIWYKAADVVKSCRRDVTISALPDDRYRDANGCRVIEWLPSIFLESLNHQAVDLKLLWMSRSFLIAAHNKLTASFHFPHKILTSATSFKKWVRSRLCTEKRKFLKCWRSDDELVAAHFAQKRSDMCPDTIPFSFAKILTGFHFTLPSKSSKFG